jgi:hypothetical protein
MLLHFTFFLIKTALTILVAIGITGIHTRGTILLNTIKKI